MTNKKNLVSENQTRLPFGATIRRRIGSFALERRALIIVGSVFILVSVVYAYCIVASVSHAATSENLMRDNASLSGSIAGLEAQYLAAGQGITESYARGLGFVSPTAQVFLERGGSLTLRDAH